MTRKIYVVGSYGQGYASWMEGEPCAFLEDADLVLFTGGEDVTPSLYNKGSHPSVHNNWTRDLQEVQIFHEARAMNKKLIGICRGAQLLSVLAGGILIQDMKHPWTHEMITKDGDEIMVTSTHHQLQYPWDIENFIVLGYCEKLSPYAYGEDYRDLMVGRAEVEMALYPDINALAIQSHPEMAYPCAREWEREYIAYCRKLLDEHMESVYPSDFENSPQNLEVNLTS